MKNIDIKEMNKEQRLALAIAKTNCYGYWLLQEIADESKYRVFEVNYKQWMKITQNITLMQGNKLAYYEILRR